MYKTNVRTGLYVDHITMSRHRRIKQIDLLDNVSYKRRLKECHLFFRIKCMTAARLKQQCNVA